MPSNYPDNVNASDPENPWNKPEQPSPEPLDDTTKIDVLLTAMREATAMLKNGYPRKAVLIMEDAEREVLRD